MKTDNTRNNPILVYNTLTRKKEEFKPVAPGQVGMYCCGQTVYNDITLGNSRSFVVFDAIRRYLIHRGYDVRFVLNFTDVDDKIIAKANAEGVPSSEIASRYIEHTLEDIDSLNILPATVNPRATEEIPEIIEMVGGLIEKGFAYEVNGSVFFETCKSKEYGKLSGKNIEDLEAGARVEVNDEKRSPADFVLWKPAKPGEPSWSSPWGEGRPGWHIECSAMSKKYLGETFDIHGGGEDLIFPHHENEIAQSEALSGCPLANYWMHNGLITVNHKKMSKSLGNFVTLREAAEKLAGKLQGATEESQERMEAEALKARMEAEAYNVIRFYLVSGYYRMPMEYGEHLLEAAKSALDRIKNCAKSLDWLIKNSSVETLKDEAVDNEPFENSFAKFIESFEAAMDDDFNTANAVAAIFELVNSININIDFRPLHWAEVSSSPNLSPGILKPRSKEAAGFLLSMLNELCGLLGIKLRDNAVTDADKKAEIDALVAERSKARAEKNWARADQIRDELSARGIELKDTLGGVLWSYK